MGARSGRFRPWARARLWRAFGVSLVFCTSGARSADAYPTFPDFIRKTYASPCTPDCTLCHNDDSGGATNFRGAVKSDGGVVPYGFGGVLSALNIDINNPAPAFAKDENAHDDTDEDGVGDIDELRAGTDPNNADPGSTFCSDLKYGCVHVSPRGSVDGIAGATSGAVLLAGLALMHRKRR